MSLQTVPIRCWFQSLLLASWWLFRKYESSWALSQDLAVCVWDALTRVAVGASGCWARDGFCLGLLCSALVSEAHASGKGCSPRRVWPPRAVGRQEVEGGEATGCCHRWSDGCQLGRSKEKALVDAHHGVESWILSLCRNFVVLIVLSLFLFNPYHRFGLGVC